MPTDVFWIALPSGRAGGKSRCGASAQGGLLRVPASLQPAALTSQSSGHWTYPAGHQENDVRGGEHCVRWELSGQRRSGTKVTTRQMGTPSVSRTSPGLRVSIKAVGFTTPAASQVCQHTLTTAGAAAAVKAHVLHCSRRSPGQRCGPWAMFDGRGRGCDRTAGPHLRPTHQSNGQPTKLASQDYFRRDRSRNLRGGVTKADQFDQQPLSVHEAESIASSIRSQTQPEIFTLTCVRPGLTFSYGQVHVRGLCGRETGCSPDSPSGKVATVTNRSACQSRRWPHSRRSSAGLSASRFCNAAERHIDRSILCKWDSGCAICWCVSYGRFNWGDEASVRVGLCPLPIARRFS